MGREYLSALVVAAHPDDEVAGAGIWLHRHRATRIHVLHITDGSPRDMETARAFGFSSCAGYASARRRELAEALRMAGVHPAECIEFSFRDKEAYLNFPALISQLDSLVEDLRPELILAPAYEGGHPDHDAAAFAVAAVCKRRRSFAHREFPLYHADAEGRMITGTFTATEIEAPEETLELAGEERELKAKMFACFPTQREMLNNFTLEWERFRNALQYDFEKAPHPGALLYERWGWGIAGEEWRRRAKEIAAL